MPQREDDNPIDVPRETDAGKVIPIAPEAARPPDDLGAVDDGTTSTKDRSPETVTPTDDLKAPYEMPAKPTKRSLRAKIVGTVEPFEAVKLREPSDVGVVLKQGDILRDVVLVEDVFEINQPGDLPMMIVPQINFPHVVVLTQACDLTHAKVLLSVLVAPMYNAAHFFKAEHLELLGFTKPSVIAGSEATLIRQNKNARYHYVAGPDLPVPDAVIDFRHYFSVSRNYLRSIRTDQLVCTVPPLWRDHISQRFAAFLSRIGLPTDPRAWSLASQMKD